MVQVECGPLRRWRRPPGLSGGRQRRARKACRAVAAPAFRLRLALCSQRGRCRGPRGRRIFRLHEQRARLRPDTNLSAWLFTTLANLCHNHHRWRLRHPEHSLDLDEGGATLRIPGFSRPDLRRILQSRATKRARRCAPRSTICLPSRKRCYCSITRAAYVPANRGNRRLLREGRGNATLSRAAATARESGALDRGTSSALSAGEEGGKSVTARRRAPAGAFDFRNRNTWSALTKTGTPWHFGGSNFHRMIALIAREVSSVLLGSAVGIRTAPDSSMKK